jgi:ubiquinone/menaquinone biosynthesis C-methylase UbiE
MTDWHEIWNKRVPASPDQPTSVTLQDLLNADGFDTGAGTLNSLDTWEKYIAFISGKLGLTPKDSIFEIGCGSGAFLFLWYKEGHKVGGIDYSENLVSLARDVLRGMDLRVMDAISVPTEAKYDIVVSNGVFHYFGDYSYAERVIERMILKAGKTIAILEVPDLAKKDESEIARRGALPPGEYDKKYKGLPHLYYQKEWFDEISRKYGCRIEIFDQNIEGYVNSRFRFNVVMKK